MALYIFQETQMNIEELQRELERKIAKLDEERQANAKKAKEERENLLLEVEMERKERLARYEAQVAAHEKEEREKVAAEEVRRKTEIEARLATEQKQNILDETLRLQREKLEWLERAISNAEFVEEQHRLSLANSRIVIVPETEPSEVSAEYPQTCADGGASSEGTDGNTPNNSLMSSHLKNILRQANRQD